VVVVVEEVVVEVVVEVVEVHKVVGHNLLGQMEL